MENTEIQRIPGVFTVPAGWPKLTFPDTVTALVADWNAEDLPLGELSRNGWAARNGVGVGNLFTASGTPAPMIQQDAAGSKYVKLGTSRLASTVNWDKEMTILVALRPHPTLNEGSSRRIFSGPAGAFRGLYYESAGVVAATQTATTSAAIARPVAPKPAAGESLIIAVRYGATKVDSFSAHSGWNKDDTPSAGVPNQSQIGFGANASSPPLENSFMHGDLYRVQAWNRLLSDLDLEAVVRLNQRLYV